MEKEFEEIQIQGKRNRGYRYERTTFLDPYHPEELNVEKLFADEWEADNKKDRGLNQGQGTLQNLFYTNHNKALVPERRVLKITERDRYVVATVIQWLGSGVGFSFLQRVLMKAGYRIEKMNKRFIQAE